MRIAKVITIHKSKLNNLFCGFEFAHKYSMDSTTNNALVEENCVLVAANSTESTATNPSDHISPDHAQGKPISVLFPIFFCSEVQ